MQVGQRRIDATLHALSDCASRLESVSIGVHVSRSVSAASSLLSSRVRSLVLIQPLPHVYYSQSVPPMLAHCVTLETLDYKGSMGALGCLLSELPPLPTLRRLRYRCDYYPSVALLDVLCARMVISKFPGLRMFTVDRECEITEEARTLLHASAFSVIQKCENK